MESRLKSAGFVAQARSSLFWRLSLPLGRKRRARATIASGQEGRCSSLKRTLDGRWTTSAVWRQPPKRLRPAFAAGRELEEPGSIQGSRGGRRVGEGGGTLEHWNIPLLTSVASCHAGENLHAQGLVNADRRVVRALLEDGNWKVQVVTGECWWVWAALSFSRSLFLPLGPIHATATAIAFCPTANPRATPTNTAVWRLREKNEGIESPDTDPRPANALRLSLPGPSSMPVPAHGGPKEPLRARKKAFISPLTSSRSFGSVAGWSREEGPEPALPGNVPCPFQPGRLLLARRPRGFSLLPSPKGTPSRGLEARLPARSCLCPANGQSSSHADLIEGTRRQDLPQSGPLRAECLSRAECPGVLVVVEPPAASGHISPRKSPGSPPPQSLTAWTCSFIVAWD